MNLLSWTLVLVALSVSDAYRILGVFPLRAKSHWMMFSTVMEELAGKGHKVDVISPYPLDRPIENYTNIKVKSTLHFDTENDITIDLVNTLNVAKGVWMISSIYGNDLCDQLIDQPLKGFIQNRPKYSYDIVIAEVFSANCYLAFGHHFDAPLVALTSSVMLPWANDATGNVDNPSYIPNYMLSFTERMNFWQRLLNTVFTQFSKIAFNVITQKQDEVLKKAFGPGVPGVRELEKKIDLHLVNSHFSLNNVRPFVPAVVEVGGLHIKDNKGSLSPELSRWLEESENGVVYFSMGTMLKSETFSPEVLAHFYASFAKLAPIRVLWKASKEVLPEGLPKNVMTMTWIPQYLVLKHKHVRAFITHGGLLGTQEAIHAGVPLIGIPMFGDQAMNIHNYVHKKIAVTVDKLNITEASLDIALRIILENPTYRKNARKISNSFRDRPMSALDTAVWWIEYMGRHGKGALRSPSLDLTWWQVALLDVYGFLLLATILFLCIIFYVFKIILSQRFHIKFYMNSKHSSKKDH